MNKMKHRKPPRIAQWLLSRIAWQQIRYSAIGDFEEQFNDICKTGGVLRGHLWYWGQVIISLPLFINDTFIGSLEMFRNYVIVALRNLRHHKGYSFINICGLAIGMASCLLISLYILDELSYDRYHKKADRIYRLVPDLITPDGPRKLAQSSPPMAPALQAAFPEVESQVRFMRRRGAYLAGENRFQEDQVYFADANIFDIFDATFLAGNPKTALKDPASVVITRHLAQKYFGGENPLNQIITAENGDQFTVKAVIENIPQSSHFRYDMIFSLQKIEQSNPELMAEWGALFFPSYVLLTEQADATLLTEKFPNMLETLLGKHHGFALSLQPLKSIYLHSNRRGENGPRGNAAMLYAFAGIAAMVLLLACVNFMNLTTARSTSRAKEVGVRKVIGAHRRQLARQFLSESVIISMLALFSGILICQLLLPAFNDFSGKQLSLMSHIKRGWFVLPLFAILTGLIAGGYPAVNLSRFLPVSVLKGRYTATASGRELRRGLVILQFSISVILITGTIVVFQQLDFLRGQNLGFDREQLFVADFRRDTDVQHRYETIKQALLTHPDVVAATASDRTPGAGVTSTSIAVINEGDTLGGIFGRYAVDADFIDTYHIKMAAGRGFSADFAADTATSVIINEAAVQHCGWNLPEDALGKIFIGGSGRAFNIIGVMKDFNFSSLHQEVEPLYLVIDPDRFRYFTLRLKPGDLMESVEALQDIWQTLIPQRPFKYTFLDEQLALQYRKEERFGNLVSIFAMLAIFIACLGILGLAAFEGQQRRKEIGVRKVLGASLAQVLMLLSKEFVKLVIIAVLIAWPIAFLVSEYWLQNFAYRTVIGMDAFLAGGIAALLISAAAISWQSLRAAAANPVDVLRNE